MVNVFSGCDVVEQYCSTAGHHTWVFLSYHPPSSPLRAPILQQQGKRQTLFFCVLSSREASTAARKTRELPPTSPRRLRTEYHKIMSLKRRTSKESMIVRVTRVAGTRHSKSRGSPRTNPRRPSEKLPGSRYRLMLPE